MGQKYNAKHLRLYCHRFSLKRGWIRRLVFSIIKHNNVKMKNILHIHKNIYRFDMMNVQYILLRPRRGITRVNDNARFIK